MISEIQKKIYNLYLKALAYGSDRPYKQRKDFSKLSFETITELTKLEKVFEKYPHLLRFEFFQAPYKIYKDAKKYYKLSYYSGYKGLTTGIAFFKNLQESMPDNQQDFLLESFKFVANFCIEHNISLVDYHKYKSVAQHDFLNHIKQYKLSFFVAFTIPGCYYYLMNLPDDEFELYFGSNINIQELYAKFNSSSIKEWLVEKREKIEEFINLTIK